MGGNCRDCIKMEEEIYWKYFQTVQFSQTLSGHFEHQLEVPKKFANHLREKLGEKVSLKGPSGSIWEVGLVTERCSLYFKLGWKKFIEDNYLEENDMLIFKYNGNSKFDVSLFDGKSSCEKESSYFVRKCTHPDMERDWRRGDYETPEKIPNKVFHGCQSPQNEDVGKIEESFHVESASEDDNVTEWTPSNKVDEEAPSSARRCATKGRRIYKRKRSAGIRPPPLEFVSNRRSVTEEEKVYTERRANAEASDESLVIVMKDYNVYWHLYLTLPAWWSNDHLPRAHVVVKLQVEGKVWPVKYFKKSTGGSFYSGWKNFVLDNSLEEGDACLFNLVSAESSSVVMDVKIFRVVQEVVPPTPLRPPSSSRRGCGSRRKLY
ncbi:hypothetical protein LIER_33871 [Lithospermum erythrorhizon]|uniref:TF-B3 domain-containing protein n=1 Tax=Lithospermum erythrorhizon TaxID=34254 RepID=A0AAV3RXW6_LITER